MQSSERSVWYVMISYFEETSFGVSCVAFLSVQTPKVFVDHKQRKFDSNSSVKMVNIAIEDEFDG